VYSNEVEIENLFMSKTTFNFVCIFTESTSLFPDGCRIW